MFVTARGGAGERADTARAAASTTRASRSCRAGPSRILLALDLGTDGGFGAPLIIGLFVAGAGPARPRSSCVERRQGDRALVPRDVLRNRVFAAACLTVLLMSAIFFSALLYLPQFMEKVLGFSALRVWRRPAAADGRVRGHVVRGRLAVRPARPEGSWSSAGRRCLAIGIFLLSFLSARLRVTRRWSPG